MKKINHGFWGFVLGLMLMHGSLFAEMVRGQVTAINRQNQSITVATQDSSGTTRGNRELALRADSQFSGVGSLSELEIGDEIQADVNKKLFRKAEVKQLISTSGAKQAAAYAARTQARAAGAAGRRTAKIRTADTLNSTKSYGSLTSKSNIDTAASDFSRMTSSKPTSSGSFASGASGAGPSDLSGSGSVGTQNEGSASSGQGTAY